ncbi:MAG: TerB family tellurite resistance protein [Myxococcaceae bacterium]|jgi:hypothetical protein|nr:TerB family tellurite resistance protein [Myxococcaceae bacterium]MCA3014726.1 TerB family tellurite resistance protein [Myxococcaceae bacterium]
MSSDAFDDRRKALEDQFFKQQNDAALQKLKEQQVRAATKEELTRLTGITNAAVLDALASLNLGGAAVLVMSMFPLVEVAWADGKVDDKERRVVLQQAENVGIGSSSEGALLLARWLDEKPELTWHQLWADYVGALVQQMKPEDRELLKNEVLGRARLVAEASGGLLGAGFAVSAAERRVLERLEQAFAPR